MGDRTQLHADFARRFARDRLHGPAQSSDPQTLDQIEGALSTYLPMSYRHFLSSHGPLFVPDLWNAVVEKEMGVHPVREFLTPAEVVDDTQAYWTGGMPRDFIGVAGDFMGNMFGFQRVSRDMNRPDDLPISLFDHDFLRIEPIAESFDEWLAWFVENVPGS